jgi:3-phenylpropionate/trans-cinnamate dioxygenase subunit beta
MRTSTRSARALRGWTPAWHGRRTLPSRTRHLLVNIRVEPADAESELEVHSNFIVYRSRSETEHDFYVGARRDVLRRVDGVWRIAHRKLIPDQNVLSTKNVSIFF